MTPSPWSGGYHRFFNSLSSYPVIIELIQVIIKYLNNLQTCESLETSDIMTLSLGGHYRVFSNLLYPTVFHVEHLSKNSYALSALAVNDHTFVKDFVKLVFMVESAKTSNRFFRLCKKN
ncbi:hypothetical protein ISN45_At03g031030 [Arabidopsis thaliana x Arabidopsis arenosa]|uniref:Uncharacterized protein n=1 Tax=Arabidopsis thaliana x Arabidopsis arenosa TaxID=1240361 RepID=A0A8T2ESN9_9BRAS|nr:hypothetical protein ISN45_At03g031030 [Arabidopsis thaliana x Arabidopsis arenosa]